jgi:hypothetical protein
MERVPLIAQEMWVCLRFPPRRQLPPCHTWVGAAVAVLVRPREQLGGQLLNIQVRRDPFLERWVIQGVIGIIHVAAHGAGCDIHAVFVY